MSTKSFSIIVFFAAFASCQCIAADKIGAPICRPLGGYKEDVCRISMTRLLAEPAAFDGKILELSGFFADGPAPLLFLDESAYSTSRTIDSVLLNVEIGRFSRVLLSENRSFVIVIGRFNAKDRTIPDGASAESVSGGMTVIEASRTNGPWGYDKPPSSLMVREKNQGE